MPVGNHMVTTLNLYLLTKCEGPGNALVQFAYHGMTRPPLSLPSNILDEACSGNGNLLYC